MVNNLLLLSGIGMMLVGIIPAVWWWKKKHIELKYFIYGGLLWVLAIIPKYLMDFTITPSLNTYALGYGIETAIILMGLYIGLRTGLFESGFTYITALKTALKKITLNQAIAFGIGFGGLEALFLGTSSFLNILSFVLLPQLIDLVPVAQQQLLIQQLNQSTAIVPAAILERIFVLFTHIFCSVLVFYSIHITQKRYLVFSIAYKSILDGILPALLFYIGTTTILGIYLIELPVIGMGIIALGGTLWIQKQWRENNYA